ncbi:MAG: ferrous iron transport protein A [Leptolyngbyaceae cyanobacterium CRU_2_3]|nr:ferrous iron transport protein A [Leptolyngbyaceae cyanobacterium CRU_2_3]
MLTTGFSVQGSSLKLLRSHERGVVSRINTSRDSTVQNLRAMGLTPGVSIAVEQRFPRFIVRVGNNRHALDEAAINAIYVRIVEH